MNNNIFYLTLIEMPGFLGGLFMMLIFIMLLLTVIGIFYMHYNSKTKVKLALIEKGMDPSLDNSDLFTKIIIIGGGFALGLIIGDKLPGGSGYGPLTGIILAAISLIVYTIFKRKQKRQNPPTRENN